MLRGSVCMHGGSACVVVLHACMVVVHVSWWCVLVVPRCSASLCYIRLST